MPHQIITRRKDGTESRQVESLTLPDLVRHIIIELNAASTAEVVIRPISLSEARNLEALEEVIGRLQTPAAIETAAKIFESMTGVRKGESA